VSDPAANVLLGDERAGAGAGGCRDLDDPLA